MFNNEFYDGGALADRQAELSVAALNAVVASVGGTLAQSSRKLDSLGVDASCEFYGVFSEAQRAPRGVTLYVQLKSSRVPKSAIWDGAECWSVSVDSSSLARYCAWGARLILAFLVLPPEELQEEWVEVDAESVKIKKSLYWVALDGATLDASKKTQVVHIPKTNVLTPSALVAVVASLVEKEV